MLVAAPFDGVVDQLPGRFRHDADPQLMAACSPLCERRTGGRGIRDHVGALAPEAEELHLPLPGQVPLHRAASQCFVPERGLEQRLDHGVVVLDGRLDAGLVPVDVLIDSEQLLPPLAREQLRDACG